MFSQKLLIRLKNAFNVTVLTGAGISADSGIPTFRGPDGLWKDQEVEKLATLEALENEPEVFWEFYNWRRQLLKDIKPNFAHFSLVDIENYFEDFTLITQNVDNLHAIAGNKNLVELHGNITRNRCTSCDHIVPMEQMAEQAIPYCDKCGAIMKPDVVLFGEPLNPKLLRQAQTASAECEVFFSIGTSSVVEPAASLPYIAKANGAYIVEINPESTPLTENADEVINIPAAKALTALVLILDRIR
ncbi:MAG: NAD-dependent deacylase [Calditrichaeota bacterium]|nr:MAG: NAD-dependent deacylase [Calditrichota bacterium]